LLDEPRPDRPRTITDERVIVATLESAPQDATHKRERRRHPPERHRL
jgi:hypothetical protein